jgi:hypothetical protein
MPGKHERALQKTRFVLIVAALAVAVVAYGIRRFLGV